MSLIATLHSPERSFFGERKAALKVHRLLRKLKVLIKTSSARFCDKLEETVVSLSWSALIILTVGGIPTLSQDIQL